jgi:CubicO group peptidase (beta-lactamase class C family)
MRRRTFLQCGLIAAAGTPLLAALQKHRLDSAAKVLADAVADKSVTSAVMYASQKDQVFSQAFGQANDQSMFLLGSITKPLCVTALMTLFDRGAFKLDDPLKKFLPEFTRGGRDEVVMSHLLTHTSGLPDQLPENNKLRQQHSQLDVFVDHAIRTPLGFAPGSKYQYSSMAILLACHVAEKISGTSIQKLVDETVFIPLQMKRSALGLGRFGESDMVPCQTERAAPESGGGDPTAKNWDWNSTYWRKLGAPWGGAHASASDIARYLGELLMRSGKVVKPETATLMTTNQNPSGLTPRGLGLNVGKGAGSPGCSEQTFGHTGSTGTLCWADRATETICVVLTSLPGVAINPHPREKAAAEIAAAMNS